MNIAVILLVIVSKNHNDRLIEHLYFTQAEKFQLIIYLHKSLTLNIQIKLRNVFNECITQQTKLTIKIN